MAKNEKDSSKCIYISGGEYRISGDVYSFMLERRVVTEKRTSYGNNKYFPSMSALIGHIGEDIAIREIPDMVKIRDKVEALEKWVKENLKGDTDYKKLLNAPNKEK